MFETEMMLENNVPTYAILVTEINKYGFVNLINY